MSSSLNSVSPQISMGERIGDAVDRSQQRDAGVGLYGLSSYFAHIALSMI
jgi:hypothetical protein